MNENVGKGLPYLISPFIPKITVLDPQDKVPISLAIGNGVEEFGVVCLFLATKSTLTSISSIALLVSSWHPKTT